MCKEIAVGGTYISEAGDMLKCIEGGDDKCKKCCVTDDECVKLACNADERSDKKSVYFK